MELEHSHSSDAIRARLASGPEVSYLRDWIYGGIDGTVTTFAVVAGAIGADFSTRVLLVLGVANLLADGFSMAAANYSATRAEHEDYQRLVNQEKRHIQAEPDGERQEIRQIYRNKGFDGDQLEEIVQLITDRRDVWIDTMVAEEYGRSPIIANPLKSAAATFGAFVLCGAIPLLPFLFNLPAAPVIATALTACVFFGIGSAKSRFSTRTWYQSGTQTLAIGLTAAAVAYVVGDLLIRLF
ncbi:VIT1/CCC1 transporter family protein [Amorphus orientalis]|uniref:VIT1/CCC1 family predicted Fe2+/Mn2+ transporter n=1 Tax=Amorphus orientalis TaxID=649198 RepID=A0AAE3VPK3_9HYPH|nr:VIT1/CCC1 transporter family protein [Amorphus orientalis]MDQ0315964.1 VIT1/CCC1 family predicted Fe2+/Mn2+ transporter [Amorphus orientalis]